MKTSRRLGIRAKLLGGFVLVLLFAGIVGYVSVVLSRRTKEQYVFLTEHQFPAMVGMADLKGHLYEAATYVRGFLLTKDESLVRNYLDVVAESQAIADHLKTVLVTDESNHFFNEMERARKDYIGIAELAIEAARKGNDVELAAILERGAEAVEVFKEVVQEWSEFLTKSNTESMAEASRLTRLADTVTVSVTAAAIVIGISLSLVLSNNITRPLAALTAVAETAASGDLTAKVPDVRTGDEVQVMASAFGSMMQSLVSLIHDVTSSAQQVAATSEELSAVSEETARASSQIAETVRQMAKGTDQQTTAATRTASSVSQLTTAIYQVATGAQSQTNVVADASKALEESEESLNQVAGMLTQVGAGASKNAAWASEGSEAVKNVVKSMDIIRATTQGAAARISELNGFSGEIKRIVDVIDDIASQTNLLALNAAIEAARAGEYGRGFAVVADEVRNLAERSMVETKSISDLIERVSAAVEATVRAIEQSVNEVEGGTSVAEVAGKSLEAVYAGATEAETVIEDLVSASKGLLERSQRVSEAIAKIVAVTEENSAATEQMAAGAQEVQNLVDSVASATEESAAATGEILASTEHLDSSVRQVSESAQSLAAMAESLQDALRKFKI